MARLRGSEGAHVHTHPAAPRTRGFSGPYFSRAFLNGVGVWGVLSMEYFWSGVTNLSGRGARAMG